VEQKQRPLFLLPHAEAENVDDERNAEQHEQQLEPSRCENDLLSRAGAEVVFDKSGGGDGNGEKYDVKICRSSKKCLPGTLFCCQPLNE
jgi:hypothetical protein